MGWVNRSLEMLQSVLYSEHIQVHVISITIAVLAICVLVILQFVKAPYGRYACHGWGLMIPCKLAWFVQELPSVVVPLVVLSSFECPRWAEWKNKIAFSLFLLHYFQRTFIFPCLIKGGKPMPFVPFIFAFLFCTVNGYLQAVHLLRHADLHNGSTTRFCAGVVVFFSGMLINIHSDSTLRSLRRHSECGYKIPYAINIAMQDANTKLGGGFFTYVSGANFFGETLEWFGFFVMCMTVPSAMLAFFTACNVGPRACQHHRWYLEKFDDYPKRRKAFIPGIL